MGIGLVFGMVVAAMIYAIGHVSGAHINPAVTLAFALARRFRWKEVPLYWISQLSGAASASLALRAILGPVADMGATTPVGSDLQSFAIEALLTFFLMFVIMAVATDVRAVGQAAAIAIGGYRRLRGHLRRANFRGFDEPGPVSRPGIGRLELDRTLGLLGRANPGSRSIAVLMVKG